MNWRRLGSRPIGERDRPRAFWICVVVVAGVGALLFALPDRAPKPPLEDWSGATSPTPAPATSPPPSPAPTAGDYAVPAATAARRFLPAYLRFVSGGGSAAALYRAAAPSLAAQIAKARVRVPPASSARRYRIIDLKAHLIATELAEVSARIGAGPIVYAIDLEVARRGDRWLVIDVEGE